MVEMMWKILKNLPNFANHTITTTTDRIIGNYKVMKSEL
ncbi:protein of unknown function [Mesotoga infera]|uniref:Uncharacterized protein n=1 Tax=Mesotoga infera TaxID=1236046 RepID=A0A7Z7LE77_9BACT|nr:protein of unknown function [Mesotoga infera]